MSAPEKVVVDLASIGVVASTLVGLLPHVAAFASLVWSCIRIYETKTVQGWLHKRKQRKEKHKCS